MNKVIVSCAGSGKTTYLIKEAFSLEKRVLITTFTDSNTLEIKNKIYEMKGAIPSNITIMPWFTFQLKHLIKPYQPSFIDTRIKGINLVSGFSTKYINSRKKEFYIKDNKVYSDKLSNLSCKTIELQKLTIERLHKLFDAIYVDEFQDFSGYDFEIVRILANNGFNMLIVCDPRQKTFSTHYENKNSKYKKDSIKYIKDKCSKNFSIEYNLLNLSHRCPPQSIKYASKIFPEFPESNSSKDKNKDDGIYFLNESECDEFLKKESNVLQLRENCKVSVNQNYPVLTFGKSKGLTRDNVLIYPTKTMIEAIAKNDFSNLKSKASLYIALTRARHKTAIKICDKDYKKISKTLALLKK